MLVTITEKLMSSQLSFFKENNDNKLNGKYYVYILINSLNNEIFYVGKGSGNRMSQHLKGFYSMIKNQNSNINSFKEIMDKRKYSNYKKLKLFFEILDSGGEILSEKVFENLSENEAFKIEQLLIFILKRRIDYLYTTKYKGRRYILRKFGGKLLNKSVGGDTKGQRVKTECSNPSELLNNYLSIESYIENSKFINDLKNHKFSNTIELINHTSFFEYLKHQSELIEKEIAHFKLENKIAVTNIV